MLNALGECVSYAEYAGVVIALENHGGITSRAESMIRLVEGVNSPWLKVNLDLGNYRESTYDDIAKTAPYAVHVHGKLRVTEGAELDYTRVKELLEDEGYNGFISIEYEGSEDPKVGVPRFASYLPNLFRRTDLKPLGI